MKMICRLEMKSRSRQIMAEDDNEEEKKTLSYFKAQQIIKSSTFQSRVILKISLLAEIIF